MLGHLQSHAEYQKVSQELWGTIPLDYRADYQFAFDLFQALDLDPAHSVIRPLYPSMGRPATYQIEGLRALILAVYFKIPFPQLYQRLRTKRQLWIIAGFASADSIPSLGSLYNLMHRFCPINEQKEVTASPKQEKRNPGKGNKLSPKRKKAVKNIIHNLKRQGKKKSPLRGPQKTLQRLFEVLAIQQSKAIGLLQDNLPISGDGTCITSHAKHYVRKTCGCPNAQKKNCEHSGRLTDPHARWGYDSSKGSYFYGYSGYFLATYQEELKCDLPLYFRLFEAQRHDSVSGAVALYEFSHLSPQTQVSHFMGDAAHDGYDFYDYLDEQGIIPVIPLNIKNTKDKQSDTDELITIAADGTPYCDGVKMVSNGYDKSQRRQKWRCGICSSKKRRQEHPDHHCSAKYGRTYHTKTDDDIRLYPPLRRKSAEWKSYYNQRTAVERINKTLMVDDRLETINIRNKSRIYWHIFASFTLIHLKAQVKYTNLNKNILKTQ